MNQEPYERLEMEVSKFDVEDVITTSGVGPGGGGGGGGSHPALDGETYEWLGI